VAGVDLHIHTTASDGRFSPAEIIRQAAAAGLTVIAITDHDTVDGIIPAIEAAKAFPRLEVIPGVEISTDVSDGEVHVLGYFVDYTDNALQARLESMRNSRRQRAQGMIVKLNGLGLHIEWDRVQEIAGGSTLGRPHIARAMLEKGYIGSLREAFDRYIGRNGPAYVGREKMTPVEAVELILQSRGLPVLAHPLTVPDPEKMVTEMKGAGLIGIEGYYGGYTAEEIDRLVCIASRYGLIITGGSDYHGLDAATETMLGGVDVPKESVERLVALARERALKLTSL